VTGDPSWADFRLEVFGEPYMVWHDGPYFPPIVDKYAEDPGLVVRELVAGIAEGDSLAAQACRELGELTEVQRSELVALLEKALPSSYGGTRSEIATSLHALGASSISTEDLAQEVCDVLLGVDHWGVRLDAAMRLTQFTATPRLVEAAAAGVRDAEYLVRFHSANTMLRWAGRDIDISDDDELFRLLVDDAGPEGWAEVARRLSAGLPGLV
jgi:hypothetical protein